MNVYGSITLKSGHQVDVEQDGEGRLSMSVFDGAEWLGVRIDAGEIDQVRSMLRRARKARKS